MERQEFLDQLEAIRKQSVGTYSGSIIKLVEMLCNLLAELHPEIPNQDPTIVEKGSAADAHIQVPNVQDRVPLSTDFKEVPQVTVSVPKHKESRKASKDPARKTKTTIKQ